MKKENRNSYIINHSLQVYLIAAILTSIIGQVNTTIDGIIVSNTLSADAISTIMLSSPILSVSSLLGSIIISGAVLLFAPAIGNQQYRQANRIFTLSLKPHLYLEPCRRDSAKWPACHCFMYLGRPYLTHDHR